MAGNDPVTNACVENSVRDAVLSCASIFGRLVTVSGLRHEDRKYYHALSWQYGVIVVDGILRSLHREIFTSWLCLSLRQQHGDLKIFLHTLAGNRPSAPGLAALCHSLLPEKYLQPERELFLNDMSLVISLVYGQVMEAMPASRPITKSSTAHAVAKAKPWIDLLSRKWFAHSA